MTREEAKKMAQSRDCSCVKGKDRDNNYVECIDKIFDWHESEIKKLTTHHVNSSLPYTDEEYQEAKRIKEAHTKFMVELYGDNNH